MRQARPSSIIQSNEASLPHIQAFANTIKKESIDCGITAMGCCNTPKCQNLATSKIFLASIIFVALIQGSIERYSLLAAKQAAVEYDFDPIILDWLLATSGLCQGLFAVTIAYWGNRVHRISWLSGLLIFQALVNLAVIIPILTHYNENNDTILAYKQNVFCTNRTIANIENEIPHSITTLVLLFIVQIGISLGNIALYTLGLSYVDDNVLEHYSPGFFGAILAAKCWGMQWGSVLVYGIGQSSYGWWLGCIILSPILFIIAVIVALFPKRLISTVVRLAADDIVEEATSNNNTNQPSINPYRLLADISFLSSIRRMVTNKVLLFNIFAACFIEMAIVNFAYHETIYLQSRFLMPADNVSNARNEWTSKLLTAMVKPPLLALVVLCGGLIIAKANPSARSISMWNIITSLLGTILFVIFIFITCNHNTLAGSYNSRLTHPYCSKSCICDEDIPFSPVCPTESVQTYYSPCHAGCSSDILSNGQRIFTNCSCGIDTEIPMENIIANDGACGYENCQHMWIIHQMLTTAALLLFSSAIIGKILITIRCVLPQDKCLALAIDLGTVSFFAYVPGKIGYQMIADTSCQYWSSNGALCYLHNSITFGNFINITSAILIGISIIFYVLVYILVKDLPLYGLATEQYEQAYRPIPLQQFTTTTRYDSPLPQNTSDEMVHEPFFLNPLVVHQPMVETDSLEGSSNNNNNLNEQIMTSNLNDNSISIVDEQITENNNKRRNFLESEVL